MLLNFLYLIAGLLLSPVLLYGAVRKGKYRAGWSQKLLGSVPVRPSFPSPGKIGQQRIWIHAVSVGEVNLASGLVDALFKYDQDNSERQLEIVVSTTTVTGFELAKKRFPELQVFYCPFDFTWAIRKTLRCVKPDLIVLVELEIWPNWLRLAEKLKIPVAIVNGRLSDNSFQGYLRLRSVLRTTFSRLTLVAAQNDTYAYRFRKLGVHDSRVHVTGSLKFDDAPLDRNTPQVHQYRTMVHAADDHTIFVAGSTQAGEERVVLDVYKALNCLHPKLRLIIVPRHADRFDEVAASIERAGLCCRRRSLIEGQSASTNHAALTTTDWQSNQVVLVDSIGELRGWWGLADIAFVGGSLGSRGGQNMLEPSGYGAAVCFGPNTKNFRDIVSELLACDAAKVVNDGEALKAFLIDMLQHPERAHQMGRAARQAVIVHQGARQKTIELLLGLLGRTQQAPGT